MTQSSSASMHFQDGAGHDSKSCEVCKSFQGIYDNQTVLESFGPTKQSLSPKSDGMAEPSVASALAEVRQLQVFLQQRGFQTAQDRCLSVQQSLSKLEKWLELMTTNEGTGKSEMTTPGYRMTICSTDGKLSTSLFISRESLSSMRLITLADTTLAELSVLRGISLLILRSLSSSLQALSLPQE